MPETEKCRGRSLRHQFSLFSFSRSPLAVIAAIPLAGTRTTGFLTLLAALLVVLLEVVLG